MLERIWLYHCRVCVAIILFHLMTSLVRDSVAFSGEPSFQATQFVYSPGPAGNPLKGLVPYKAPLEREDGSPRFPHSMEFHYFPLSDLVCGKNDFDWAPLEAVLEDVRSRRNQTVFRVFLEYPGKKDIIPRYLVRGGLKIHRYLNTNTAPLPAQAVETPNYEDPELRALLVRFITEMGKQYDGDPRIAFITAGLLGTWGEWHTYPRTELFASKMVQKEVMDAYANAFQKTPILLRYPAGPNDPQYHDATVYSFGFHDDSFAHSTVEIPGKASDQDDWFFHVKLVAAGMAQKWTTVPIGGEIRPEVWGCCFDEQDCAPDGQSFDRCRRLTHVSWLMDTGMFREVAKESRYRNALQQVRAMGYDFFIHHADVKMLPTRRLEVTVAVTNHGIAPLYHSGWVPEVYIGSDLPTSPTEYLARDLDANLLILPEESDQWVFQVTHQPAAGDRLYIRLPNPMENGRPLVFANQNAQEDENGWLRIGSWK